MGMPLVRGWVVGSFRIDSRILVLNRAHDLELCAAASAARTTDEQLLTKAFALAFGAISIRFCHEKHEHTPLLNQAWRDTAIPCTPELPNRSTAMAFYKQSDKLIKRIFLFIETGLGSYFGSFYKVSTPLEDSEPAGLYLKRAYGSGNCIRVAFLRHSFLKVLFAGLLA